MFFAQTSLDGESGPQYGSACGKPSMKTDEPKRIRHVMLMVDPPIPARFDGIMRHAKERGWRLTVANRLVRAPRGWDGDGAIVTLRGDPAVLRFVEDLSRRGIPVVDLTLHRPDVALPRVIPDYRGAGLLAARHFADIGLKRTAWFSVEWSNVQRLFFEGLADGMAGVASGSGGPAGPPARFVLSRLVSRSRLDDPDRFAAILGPHLASLPKPVGLLAYNDEEAARLLGLCLDAGLRVPDEIAILGIGNDAFLCENQAVPLSSVDDELERCGFLGACLLERLMDGEPPPTAPVLVPCTRVWARQSTGVLATENPILRRVLERLCSRLANPPSMAQLAEEAGVSRATLDRIFQRELGRPAHAELLRRRLIRAKELLSDSALPIAEISRVCGFCNPGYFAVAFSRAEGVTPRRWRRGETNVNKRERKIAPPNREKRHGT